MYPKSMTYGATVLTIFFPQIFGVNTIFLNSDSDAMIAVYPRLRTNTQRTDSFVLPKHSYDLLQSTVSIFQVLQIDGT